MSVVAWDGKTLAADRQVTNCGHKSECEKLWIFGPSLALASTGGWAEALAMVEWYSHEWTDNKKPYPDFQSNNERWTRLIVARPDGILVYEQAETPIRMNPEKPFAWGSGRDFALGAMAAGADAIRAVEITNQMCDSCGFGVTSHRVR